MPNVKKNLNGPVSARERGNEAAAVADNLAGLKELEDWSWNGKVQNPNACFIAQSE